MKVSQCCNGKYNPDCPTCQEFEQVISDAFERQKAKDFFSKIDEDIKSGKIRTITIEFKPIYGPIQAE